MRDPRLCLPGAAQTLSRRISVNIRRFAVVSLLLATGLGLAGCSTNSQPGSAAPTTPAQLSPAGALTNALATLKNTGYDATLTLPAQGATVKTSVDYYNKAATQAVSVNQASSETFTEIGADLWVKADFGPLTQNLNIDKTKWYKFEASKLGPEAIPFDLSGGQGPHPTRPLAWPLGIGAAFANVANVTRTDATHITGVVDLTEAVPMCRCDTRARSGQQYLCDGLPPPAARPSDC